MSQMAPEQPRAVWCCSTCGAIYHKDFPRCPIDGAEVRIVDRDPLLGTAIGHYQIDELIGEGGMGRVYLARHANLPSKRYAFKVLLGDHSASAAMRQRFTREAERASQLDHPNIAGVVDFGQTALGLLYIVMDYVDGPSLVTLIGQTPMPPARVVTLAREISRGLIYAHAAGIVHRDLKPENILVTPGPGADPERGEVPRLVDFGLAMSVDQSDARLTESGMTMGTPAFAAPEQLSGKPIDHRADLYALGMTMFEMLTGGISPVDGSVMEVVAARTARDAPRISERAPTLAIPQVLEDIVARLTRKKPAERYASALEVIAALDAIDPAALIMPAPGAAAAAVSPDAAPVSPQVEPATGTAVASRAPAPSAVPSPSDAASSGRSTPIAALDRDPASTDQMRAQRTRRGPQIIVAAGTCALVVIALYAFLGGRHESRAHRAARPAAVLVEAAAPASPAVTVERTGARPPVAPTSTAGADRAVGSDGPDAAAPPATSVVLDVQSGPDHPSDVRTPGAMPARAPRPEPARPRRLAPVPIPDDMDAVAQDVAPATPQGAGTPAPPARALAPRFDGVEVNGSLAHSEVERAVRRQRRALERCRSPVPGTVVAHFTIGEAKRASQIHADGPAAACVESALTDVRTESAPDIGDVEVTVRLTFAVKT